MKIIGITGQKRAGKDTIAKLLNKKYHYATYHFAAPIKSMIGSLLEYIDSRDILYQDDMKENPISPIDVSVRQLAQTLGTEWGRTQISQDLWIKVLEFNSQWEDAIVIPDVRFENEAQWIKSKNGIIISVRRESNIVDTHASELGIDAQYIDYHVTNNGSIDELYDQVNAIMKP